MTPTSKVRDHLNQAPQVFSLKRLSLVADKPWVLLPNFVCRQPLFGRVVLPEWGLFAGERHQDFPGQSADAEEPETREQGPTAKHAIFPVSIAIRLGYLLVRIDQYLWQTAQRKVWRLSRTGQNLFTGVWRHVLAGSDRQFKSSMSLQALPGQPGMPGSATGKWIASEPRQPGDTAVGEHELESWGHERVLGSVMGKHGPAVWRDENVLDHVTQNLTVPNSRQARGKRASEHGPAAVSHSALHFPALGKLIETSTEYATLLPAPNGGNEKANGSSGSSSRVNKSHAGEKTGGIEQIAEHARNAVLRDRLFGMNLEKLTVRGTEEREAAKPNGVSTRRDSLHQLPSHKEHRMDERSAEITETQKTITRLLSMANETKETETRASQTQRHVLKDLEKKIESMQELNSSDIQMLRHMLQSLADKLERRPQVSPVPHMKRWSFYGPL